MKFSRRNKSVIDFVFVLALLAVFAVSALFVVLFGAKVFRNTNKDMGENFTKRTACFYVQEKLKAFDEKDSIIVGEYDNKPVLELWYGNDYVTYIYSYNSHIMEYTAPAELDFDASNGKEIVAVNEFEVKKSEDNLLHIHIVDENENASDLYKCIRSGVEND